MDISSFLTRIISNEDLSFNTKTEFIFSLIFFALIPSIKTVCMIGFSITWINKLFALILTVTSLKNPES